MNETHTVCDIAILGSGPGGYVTALYAAQCGLKSVLIEKGKIGGTCLNRGCIPTKALLHGTEVLDTLQNASRFGVTVHDVGYDLAAMYSYRDATVGKLRKGIQGLLKHHGVTVISGHGELTGPGTLRCTGADSVEHITASDIVLATGSQPSVPPIPGLEEAGYWTSDTLLESNPELPERIIIIGGGVIGVESATILHDLGVHVTVIEMLPQLLPRMDAEIAGVLKKSLKRRGITVHTGTTVQSVLVSGAEKHCSIAVKGEGGEEILPADELLVAIGRSPSTDGCGFDTVGIHRERGFVTVDRNFRTSLAHHYAIGDITGGWMLAHAASAHGMLVVDHILGKPNFTNTDIVPACVYTRPEIGAVGLTAEEAEEQGYEIRQGYFPMSANSKASITMDTEGFTKIISDAATGALLGAHMIGPRATDLISEMALAIASEVTVDEVAAAIHPHPTVSESVMEAAHDVFGHVIHSIPRRRKQ